jgi:hypothetical protein
VKGFLKLGELALHSLLNLLDPSDDIKAAVDVLESLIDHSGKFFGLLTGIRL